LPAPSQFRAGSRDSSSPETAGAHEAATQVVLESKYWQLLLPSHLPLWPQTELDAQVVVSRGVPFAAILLQVPTLPEIEQLWQAPPQAVAQHTPSVQTLLRQSLLTLQLCPGASLVPH
jgi:hypothetical protein